ncbi:MAG: hypothetical protein A3G33_00850 [Omnitrophica bacterium RIFCSPLOWO2_12_FULL_44_17]|uniref:STAS domain-containing protein n=1 Tax=Candidatus Danuiimicrobium aquiferis TaxID=1801832 RepID=A0A1G1L2S8_9BACT|nr:MAG: hypothetical protein A3B72_06330 [Omnitrophica bacterium RIFCSPHIGHO2_02_FULL_45_28]OGW89784.1 MAG: hypothetical protein A3E74_07460 [Omnitrophica bacterium RIFCSPHIGHO2_12_FULL_44_12]OGW99428.1 MAG: hypothetical protein A3G33_00850 [Omnitrophica bacterium RIFCSPLOWO2_12_FULL_44_17]OGX03040.1 MAG: hypothetical protein A3J12_04835 [Omnitrophica bacterium RIFCSPLOWO2_02_FULL_44_11]
MAKVEEIKLGLRKIGRVQVFDLGGKLEGDCIDSVIDKIEQTIQKKKLRRVILNLQKVIGADEVAIRKLVACFLRPQRSLIFSPDQMVRDLFQTTYLPDRIKLCKDEEEVAEAFGSFLFLKDKIYEVAVDETKAPVKHGLERRRSKRIRVAIPVRLKFKMQDGKELETRSIATNVSQGGLFAEFLDLDAPDITQMQGLEGTLVSVMVPPNETFKEEVTIPGKINRFEVMKKQYGIAIQFL